MKVFSNKREKMCVFFKSRGSYSGSFSFYTLFIYSIFPLKEKYIFP